MGRHITKNNNYDKLYIFETVSDNCFVHNEYDDVEDKKEL